MRRTWLARVLAVVVAMAATGAVLAAPARAADPPLLFQLRSELYGTCGATDAGSPYRIRGADCDVLSLPQRWIFDPLTKRVTNGRLSLAGRCLALADEFVNSEIRMLPCAADDDRQKWTTYRFTPDGCLTLRPLFDNGFGQWTVLTSEGTAAWQALLTFGVTSRPCLTFPLLSA